MNEALKQRSANLVDPLIAARLLEQSGPAAMYDYLEKNGDRYARLANGVAKGNSLGGNAALAHMKYVAQKHGRTLGEEEVDLIRHDMAQAYLNLLRSQAVLGAGAKEITWEEARKFHSNVFKSHDLPPEAWTLYTPLSVSTEGENDSIWDRTLASAGDPIKELSLATGLWNKMRIYAGIYVNEAEQLAYGQSNLPAAEKRQEAFDWMASNTSFSNIGEAATVSASVVGGSLAALAAALTPEGHPEIVKTLFDALFPDYLLNHKRMWDRIDALFETAVGTATPLILDLDGNGIQTLGLAAGVQFDHDGNGFAERTGWVGRNDGMLVLDRNGNGVIDDGNELFGNNTVLPNGTKAVNGFAALAALDSNKDGKISASDALFASLRVWRDRNSDGKSDGGELVTLAEAGVASIDLSYQPSSYTDPEGNKHSQVGSFTRTDGTRGDLHDVWFAVDARHSVPTDVRQVGDDVLAMPNIASVGNVYSLHQAIARDDSGKLIALVRKFSATSNASEQLSLTSDILMAWTRSDRYSKSSRGSVSDGRKVHVMEAILGREYYQKSNGNAPGANAAIAINKGYDELVRSMRAHLSIQTHLKPLLAQVTIDLEHDGALDVSGVVKALQAQYEQAPDQALSQLRELNTVLQDLGSSTALEIMTSLKNFGDSQGVGVLRELAVSTKASYDISVKAEKKDVRESASDQSTATAVKSLRTMSGLISGSETSTLPDEQSSTEIFFTNATNALVSAMVSYAPEASVVSGMQVNTNLTSYTTLSVGQK